MSIKMMRIKAHARDKKATQNIQKEKKVVVDLEKSVLSKGRGITEVCTKFVCEVCVVSGRLKMRLKTGNEETG